jgi:hypothetical protein
MINRLFCIVYKLISMLNWWYCELAFLLELSTIIMFKHHLTTLLAQVYGSTVTMSRELLLNGKAQYG